MVLNLGNVPASSTIYVPFATYNSSGASVTITGLAVTDIEIYKNGSVTQRSSDNGYTLLDTDGIDFDGITGIHGFSIDLSDNTDAGFYSTGASYWLVVSAITVDSQTVNFVYYFTIDKAHAANVIQVAGSSITTLTGAYPSLGIAESGTMQSGSTSTTAVLRSATSIADDNPIGYQIWITGGTGVGQTRFITDWVSSTDTATVAAWLVTPDNTSTYIVFPSGAGTASLNAADVRAAIGMASANLDTQLSTIDNFLDTEVAAILADTNELQTDWANGGRLDVILDARASQTSVDTVSAAVDTEVAAIKVKTDQLTFGVTNTLNANITHVIADPIQQAGDNTTAWGGSP